MMKSSWKAKAWNNVRTHKGRLQNEGNDVGQTGMEIMEAMRCEPIKKAEHQMIMMATFLVHHDNQFP